ncbi:MAG: tetratricopeptide repeat protein [Bacteroidales bacterium]|nr:tetratricopeptide repeat protein [Bacteroidales bacterium]
MKFLSFNIIMLIGLALAILPACNPGNQSSENQKDSVNLANPEQAKLNRINQDIKESPSDPDLYEERALYFIDRGNYNEAFKDISSALDIDSNYAGYHITLADVYLGMGKLKKTVQSLERSLELDKSNPTAYLKLAEINIAIRDYKKALQNIDMALRIDELASKGYLLRGIVMLETGDTLKGIRNFQRAIDMNQDYFEAYMQLGVLYAGKKNSLAIDYFKNALNIQPDNIDALYNLAMFYQDYGEFEKAISNYKSIIEIDPSFFLAFYNIGYINLVYLSDYDAAIEYFTDAIEIKDDYAEAYYNRGFAWELKKNVEKSRENYQKSLEYKPNYEKAIEGLNRIDEFISRQQNP